MLRFIKWQLYNTLYPYPAIFPFTSRTNLIMQKGMSGATGNLYCGLHEYEDMGFLLHFLRPGDLFADVGANIGSYSVLASGHAGSETICMEPVPDTYRVLKQNIANNQISNRVTALNIGIGSETGSLKFTNLWGPRNRVAGEHDKNTIDVAVDRLDHVLKDRTPCLIKIDVEGFEGEVMKGAHIIFSDPSLKALIIEFNPGNSYGADVDEQQEELIRAGFALYAYDPIKRTFTKGKTGKYNSLYLRDFDFVADRILTAEKFSVNNMLV